jgi:hypothetical protein
MKRHSCANAGRRASAAADIGKIQSRTDTLGLADVNEHWENESAMQR